MNLQMMCACGFIGDADLFVYLKPDGDTFEFICPKCGRNICDLEDQTETERNRK